MPKTAAVSDPDGLQVRLVGTATYQGSRVALIEQGPSGKQCLLEAGDEFEGYCVEEVKADAIRFRHGTNVHSLSKQGVRTTSGTSAKPAESSPPGVKTLKAGQYKVRVVKTYASAPKKTSSVRFISPMIGEVRSGYGTRKHPMGGGSDFHNGVDIAAPHGTRVKAAADGVVTTSGYDCVKGNYIEISHANGYKTCYFHLNKKVVSKGAKVLLGATIGYEGRTGHTTGPHLHFEIRRNGKAVDPALYIPALKN
jgi:murein DD-endopeptidase MepM/ murein hydrolase activator NlpD